MEHTCSVHFTSVEIQTIGPAIAATAALMGGAVTLRGTRTREHHLRMWDRKCAVYEEVLIVAAKWRDTRHDGREDANPSDDNYEKQLSARLRMYGDPAVQEAYSDYLRADRDWAAARIHRQAMLSVNSDERFERATPEEIKASQQRLRAALEAADEAGRTLIAEVQRAIHRPPKHDRFYRWRLRRRRKKIDIP